MADAQKPTRWGIANSMALYRLAEWGQGFFGINGKGKLVAHPSRDSGVGVDVHALVTDAQARGLSLPLLVRFSDILSARVAHLQGCFASAIAEEGYEGRYFAVYPIKVNQQRQVVEEVVRFGAEFQVGLEAGSKPELHAVLAMLEAPEAVIVCNGYKDADYVRLALMAQRLGRRVFLVVEKLGELALILRIAAEVGIRPLLGVRLRMASAGEGKWMHSGGDHSKFGLTAGDLVAAVEQLRRADALDCFRMLHIHVGSQVPNIRPIKDALREMTRYFAELHRLGCPIDYVDLGGGLGVDYDGTGSTSPSSINYSEQEYANDVVSAFATVCRAEGLPHPHLVTESGRALTAHHAMLVINVLESTTRDGARAPAAPDPEAPEPLHRLERIRRDLSARTAREAWHDALEARDEANQLFELGYLSLEGRAWADGCFWRIARRVETLLARLDPAPEEMAELSVLLADRYFCNFSVFQSLPDAWAIGQQFPVVPLHRLRERPSRAGILQDITCDSDGQLTSYVGAFDNRAVLPLHALKAGEPYYLGVFLTGAYQEILGDLHNLFGDTDAIHVALNEDGTWRYEQIIHGENVSRVLAYVQFNRDTLVDRISRQVQDAIRARRITAAEGKAFRNLYEDGLDGLTYLARRKPARGARRTRHLAAVQAPGAP